MGDGPSSAVLDSIRLVLRCCVSYQRAVPFVQGLFADYARVAAMLTPFVSAVIERTIRPQQLVWAGRHVQWLMLPTQGDTRKTQGNWRARSPQLTWAIALSMSYLEICWETHENTEVEPMMWWATSRWSTTSTDRPWNSRPTSWHAVERHYICWDICGFNSELRFWLNCGYRFVYICYPKFRVTQRQKDYPRQSRDCK